MVALRDLQGSTASVDTGSTTTMGEKKEWIVETRAQELPGEQSEAERYGVTEAELDEMKRVAAAYTDEDVRKRIVKTLKIHKHDPNFPHETLEKFRLYTDDEDVRIHPENHQTLISEVKLEIALITNNSPYTEVRAVIDNFDDPATPCSTIRSWGIGLFFAILLALINQLFSIRQPQIHVGAHIAQLLAFPVGRAAAAWLPDWGVTLFGQRHSLNPGPFSKKEHMLITIMASVGGAAPYTTLIVWTQFLPQFFNQRYAGQFAYQILIGLGTNFIGYGLAGLCRSFLVYPSYCVWPQSLVTIALNTAFHDERKSPVRVPFVKRFMTMSRLKFFFITFTAMFIYFWIPNFFFMALSMFSWMSWIAPNNTVLNSVVGFNNGVGLNPVPTFDWNNVLHGGADPLMLPLFTTLNKFAGNFLSLFIVLGLWYANSFNTGYLPLNSNRLYDNTGKLYNVTRAVDNQGLFNATSYERYSPPFLASGSLTNYIFNFATYTATFTYAIIYHHHEMKMGFVELYNSFFRRKNKEEGNEDVHNRLMAAYKEVPGWWFFAVLVFAIACGIAGVVAWPTYTSPAVVFYGILLCLLFIVPIGVIKAMTGVEVSLAILAEFIGGSLVPGNALAMNYMKAYGYVTAAHAIGFSNDLKLAHYVKIPPRTTFTVQMVATLLSTFICTAVLNYQMRYIPGVCTPDAPFRFMCPHVTAFMSASVLWGTIGPKKVFGSNGMYTLTLLGFPFGMLLVLASWYVKRHPRLTAHTWLRQVHPVVMMAGAHHWAPYNIGYIWPAVPVAWLSWVYVKKRYMAFWAKYNFVLSGSLATGIAMSALVIFFAVQVPGLKLNWWGNNVVYQGCEAGSAPCRLKYLAKGEYFGPRYGEFH